jgi:hypothetical protein
MAEAITHVAYSAVFTPSGGSAWTILDLVDINDSEAGNLTELTTDNSLVVNGMFVDSNRGSIAISAKNMAQSTNAGAVNGTVGSLVLKYAKRSAGKGYVASNYLSITYGNAVLNGISRAAAVVGDGNFTVNFSATVKTAAVGA